VALTAKVQNLPWSEKDNGGGGGKLRQRDKVKITMSKGVGMARGYWESESVGTGSRVGVTGRKERIGLGGRGGKIALRICPSGGSKSPSACHKGGLGGKRGVRGSGRKLGPTKGDLGMEERDELLSGRSK